MEKTRIEFETTYAPSTDITFIMKYTYREEDGELLRMEVVTFYCGEPDEKNTRDFIEYAEQNKDQALVAVYDR